MILFFVFLCKIWREFWRNTPSATFSRIWVSGSKNFTKISHQKRHKKRQDFTQISACWGVVLGVPAEFPHLDRHPSCNGCNCQICKQKHLVGHLELSDAEAAPRVAPNKDTSLGGKEANPQKTSHFVFCGIADYRCYTPTSVHKNGLSQSKDRPRRGASQKKLASEAYRATGGIARNSIANRAFVGH